MLMAEKERVAVTWVFNSRLVWLFAQEDFIVFIHHESFKSYILCNIVIKRNVDEDRCVGKAFRQLSEDEVWPVSQSRVAIV
jgi:hypothetical protein